MLDKLLTDIASIIEESAVIAPVLSFLAGILTSFTPCSISNIPLIIGYVGGTGEKSSKKAFAYSAAFALGTSVTFTALGIIATTAGKLMGTSSKVFTLILGIIMILMALQIWEIVTIIPSTGLMSKSKAKGYVGAFAAGILGGVFSSPCSTPVLIVLLAIVAGKGNLSYGIVLMFLYSLGHSTLAVIAGTSTGLVRKIISDPKYSKTSAVIKTVTGIVILFIGLYMLWISF